MNDNDYGRIDRIERDVAELRQTVYGNGGGNPGIRSRVEKIEIKMDTGVRILWGLLVLAVPSAISLITTAVMLLAHYTGK